MLTGRLDSSLAHAADIVLDVSVEQEACPHNLAPTTSTTTALAMGDALAVAVLEARGFSAEEFARRHPGGTLGRRLLLHVENIMRTGTAIPRVSPDTRLAAGLVEMSAKGLGLTAIVDGEDKVLGVFTDGDLRRALDRHTDLHTTHDAPGHDRRSAHRGPAAIWPPPPPADGDAPRHRAAGGRCAAPPDRCARTCTI